jgi:hypothetical protein
MNRRARAAFAGAAVGAVTALTASELGRGRPKLPGLLVLFVIGSSVSTAVRASVKATAVEARINDMLNNGFSTGGDVHVVGKHYADGGLSISGTTLTLNHGSPSKQGGGPGSYSPAYESALAAEIASVIDKLASANIF